MSADLMSTVTKMSVDANVWFEFIVRHKTSGKHPPICISATFIKGTPRSDVDSEFYYREPE